MSAIVPSHSRTPLAAPIVGSGKVAEAIAELHSWEWLGLAADSTALAAFLLSEDTGWITVQVIGVDGGRGSPTVAWADRRPHPIKVGLISGRKNWATRGRTLDDWQ